MYRETLLGIALANALEEMQPTLQLTEEQQKTIWRSFETSFQQVLSDAPKASRLIIRSRPLSDSEAGGGGEGDIPRVQPTRPSTIIMEPPCASPSVSVDSSMDASQRVVGLAAPQLEFPVYRVVDGVWTIVLKNVDVCIQDGGGKQETIQLDFLKCLIRDRRERKRARN